MDEQGQALLAAPSTVMVSPGALRWTDESVSAMAVALTASILRPLELGGDGGGERENEDGAEQDCI